MPDIDSNFRPKPVVEFLDGAHHFLIPSFQRGYRWEDKQVVDMLEDIKQFADDSRQENNSYFLQPIVVKPVKMQRNATMSIAWEVLDGQQRLTTMLLLLKKFIKSKFSQEDAKYFQEQLFDITYRNRPALDFDNPNPADNIDSYYLAESKKVIDEWFKAQRDKKISVDGMIQCLFYDTTRQVKFIWYAINETNEDLVSINFFNRLNKGRISLTSSELIKALFIMDYDRRAGNNPLPSEQLSMEWNEIERKFQDDKFWYFISDDSKEQQTRIDVLFDFVTHRPADTDTDTDYSYRLFQNLYDNCRAKERGDSNAFLNPLWQTMNVSIMQEAWKIVKKTFDRMVAWYDDNMYYHYVGYLVAIGFAPLEIYNTIEQAKLKNKLKCPKHEWTNDDTLHELQKMIMEKFKIKNEYLTKEAIDGLEYGSEFIHRLLLLFNIETCRKTGNQRFTFDKYKGQMSWDVEHVDSQNDASLQEFEDRIRWLNNVAFILEMEAKSAVTRRERAEKLCSECKKLVKAFSEKRKVDKNLYSDFYLRINKYFSFDAKEDVNEENVNLTAKNKDNISNLTLLDSATNREYKDAPFPYKRYRIVDIDKNGERFIPIGTRNLFLKYYTDSNAESSYLDAMRWNSADRRDYIKAIHQMVDPIFDTVASKPECHAQGEI